MVFISGNTSLSVDPKSKTNTPHQNGVNICRLENQDKDLNSNKQADVVKVGLRLIISIKATKNFLHLMKHLFILTLIIHVFILQIEKPKPLVSRGTEVLISTEKVIEGSKSVLLDLGDNGGKS